jgi:hypothetical protein
MMPFGPQVLKNIDKVTQYPIKYIGPSHGPVYDDPAVHHRRLPRLGRRRAAEHRLPALRLDAREHAPDGRPPHGGAGRPRRAVERFDLTTLDAGELASSLVHAGTIVLGTPTVLTGPHPLAAYAAFLANALRPRTKFATVIGSYGWAGKTVETLVGMMPKLKVRVPRAGALSRVCRGRPTTRLSTGSPTRSPRSTRASRRATSPINVCRTDAS